MINLTKKGENFVWSPECQESFQKIKDLLMTAPIVAYQADHGGYILDTDACDTGIGAVLSQVQEGQEKKEIIGSLMADPPAMPSPLKSSVSSDPRPSPPDFVLPPLSEDNENFKKNTSYLETMNKQLLKNHDMLKKAEVAVRRSNIVKPRSPVRPRFQPNSYRRPVLLSR
ncbi:unnamed protein product [Mytilus coruscus]|uniref:Reverse transcriptase/retrotransposon-derived protein RNase H-like domain-containing protein n=1 Tax=Mytilus coruscus TaxID=42192 RepID=A0A6J8ECB0_MYTCO|nr:unnamed protein product [Mytilus coruscus]